MTGGGPPAAHGEDGGSIAPLSPFRLLFILLICVFVCGPVTGPQAILGVVADRGVFSEKCPADGPHPCPEQRHALELTVTVALSLCNVVSIFGGIAQDMFGAHKAAAGFMVGWTVFQCVAGIAPATGYVWSIAITLSAIFAFCGYVSLGLVHLREACGTTAAYTFWNFVAGWLWDAAVIVNLGLRVLYGTHALALWEGYVIYGVAIGLPATGVLIWWQRKPPRVPIVDDRPYVEESYLVNSTFHQSTLFNKSLVRSYKVAVSSRRWVSGQSKQQGTRTGRGLGDSLIRTGDYDHWFTTDSEDEDDDDEEEDDGYAVDHDGGGDDATTAHNTSVASSSSQAVGVHDTLNASSTTTPPSNSCNKHPQFPDLLPCSTAAPSAIRSAAAVDGSGGTCAVGSRRVELHVPVGTSARTVGCDSNCGRPASYRRPKRPQDSAADFDIIGDRSIAEATRLAKEVKVPFRDVVRGIVFSCREIGTTPFYWAMVLHGTAVVMVGYFLIANVSTIARAVADAEGSSGDDATAKAQQVTTYMMSAVGFFNIVPGKVVGLIGMHRGITVVIVTCAVLSAAFGVIFYIAEDLTMLFVSYGIMFLWRVWSLGVGMPAFSWRFAAYPEALGVAYTLVWAIAGSVSAAGGAGLTALLQADPAHRTKAIVGGLAAFSALSEAIFAIAVAFGSDGGAAAHGGTLSILIDDVPSASLPLPAATASTEARHQTPKHTPTAAGIDDNHDDDEDVSLSSSAPRGR